MVKRVRIISLGEIVTINLPKTIEAFTALIAKKKPTADSHEINKIKSAIVQVMQAKSPTLLTAFKLGKLDEKNVKANEETFTLQMIAALKEATNVELSIEEFDQAWNAMNPSFAQFKSTLQQAIQYNKNPDNMVIFISFTNSKDIRHLSNELKSNDINCLIGQDDELISIEGIPLHLTYTSKQTKAELIEDIIKKLNGKPTSEFPVAHSMSQLFQSKDEELDIKYIRSVNKIDDPVLKADLDQTNEAVEKKAQGLLVDSVLWMKHEGQSLEEALNNFEAHTKTLNVATL